MSGGRSNGNAEQLHWDTFYEGHPYRPDTWSEALQKVILDGLRLLSPWVHYTIARTFFVRGRLVEIGCGRARASVRLALRRRAHFVGVDLSRSGLRDARDYAARMRATCDFVLADARFLPFRDGSFALAWSAGVLEHIDDLTTVTRETLRILADGGYSVILLPSSGNLLVRLRDALAMVTGRRFSFDAYWGEAHVIYHPPESILGQLRGVGFATPHIRKLARELFIEYAVVARRPQA